MNHHARMPLASRINPRSRRTWLNYASNRNEYIAGVVINGDVKWLRATFSRDRVRFVFPSLMVGDPRKFKPADPRTVERIERDLQTYIARGF